MARLTASDKDWMAENDARTLAEAQVIRGDKNRLNKAVKKAKEMASDKEKEAKAMKRVAKTKNR